MIFSRQFDELSAGNSGRDITPFLDVTVSIVDPMHDERRHSYRREHIANINQCIHACQCQGRARTGASSLVAGPPIAKFLVMAQTRREVLDPEGTAPLFF